MSNFKMSYFKTASESENEGMHMVTYGVRLLKECPDGSSELLDIPNITCQESRIDRLIAMMERGTVTPMTAHEIVEDFLEM